MAELRTLLLLPVPGWAQTITIPTGTVVYGELDQRVSSKKKEQPQVGDIIKAHIWRGVVVAGRTVIKAGAPMVVRVANVKQAKFAGIKSKLQLETVSVKAADDTEILLDGGYNRAGKGRMALSISLAALIAWPTIFIKGKQVIPELGTLFDASVQNAVAIAESASPTNTPCQARTDLVAEVLYDCIDPTERNSKYCRCGYGAVTACWTLRAWPALTVPTLRPSTSSWRRRSCRPTVRRPKVMSTSRDSSSNSGPVSTDSKWKQALHAAK